MAEKEIVKDATVTIYNKADDTLVDTCILDNLQYVTRDLLAGEYYYKVEAPDRGTVIDYFDIVDGETECPIEINVALYEAIANIPVTVKDKDAVDISDALVKIANIEGIWDGASQYDVSQVPVGDKVLEVSHSNTSYQSISRTVVIESGASFDEVLYPVLSIFIKVQVTIESTGEIFDATSRTNCILYDLTEDSTVDTSTRVLKSSGGFFMMSSKNNGTYKLYVPTFNTIYNGNSYTVEKIETSKYVDYNASDNGDVYIDLRTSATEQYTI